MAARLRYNGLATGAAGSTVALTLGASLTNSATSVTFSAALTYNNGTSVPTITGSDYIPLSILDANGHVSEIVWLTAYTSGATTGTITRAQEGTSGVSHSSGDKVVNGPTVADFGTVETYDAAIVAALTGVVHRWKFDESSGTTVADSVGSLNLTMSGTYTRHITSPTGFGTTFGASAKATSSGLGSIPTGNNDRCVIVLFRTTSTSQQSVFSYAPSGTTRAWWSSVWNSGSAGNLGQQVWSDDLSLPVQTVAAEISDSGGPDWHLAAFGYKAAAQATYGYYDGSVITRRLGGTLSTGTSGNAQVGLSTASEGQFAGDIDDVLVMNNWPGKAALDRLLSAAAGIGYKT